MRSADDHCHVELVPLDVETAKNIKTIKTLGNRFIDDVKNIMRDGREYALFKTKVEEEAVMWAVKGYTK